MRGGVKVTVLNAGYCRALEAAVVRGGRWRQIELPALFALIQHPEQGAVLFDTGYHTRIWQATQGFPRRLYRWVLSPEIGPSMTAAAQLSARGIEADEVRWVIVSHFDPDHIGGLRDFPSAQVVCHVEAWHDAKGPVAWSDLRRMPGHLPDDLGQRVHLVDRLDGSPVGPFRESYDLFGGGEVRLVSLPGHAPGQLGAWVEDVAGQRWLLAADGCWTRADLRRGPGPLHRRLAIDRAAQQLTYAKLRKAFADDDVILVPSHCPEAADELLT